MLIKVNSINEVLKDRLEISFERKSYGVYRK